MGLFRPYERNESAATSDQIATLTPKGQKAAAKAASKEARSAAGPVEAPTPVEPADDKIQVTRSKTEPTRSRRQAEADRMEKLHPTLTPRQQRKASSKARRAARMEAMDKIENSAERSFARDYLDTRWTVNEFMLPAFILLMAATMATMTNVMLSSYILLGMWLIIAMVIVNTFLIWRGFKKEFTRRFPNSSLKGLLSYILNRSIMLRRFRQPGPRIKRGDPV